MRRRYLKLQRSTSSRTTFRSQSKGEALFRQITITTRRRTRIALLLGKLPLRLAEVERRQRLGVELQPTPSVVQHSGSPPLARLLLASQLSVSHLSQLPLQHLGKHRNLRRLLDNPISLPNPRSGNQLLLSDRLHNPRQPLGNHQHLALRTNHNQLSSDLRLRLVEVEGMGTREALSQPLRVVEAVRLVPALSKTQLLHLANPRLVHQQITMQAARRRLHLVVAANLQRRHLVAARPAEVLSASLQSLSQHLGSPHSQPQPLGRLPNLHLPLDRHRSHRQHLGSPPPLDRTRKQRRLSASLRNRNLRMSLARPPNPLQPSASPRKEPPLSVNRLRLGRPPLLVVQPQASPLFHLNRKQPFQVRQTLPVRSQGRRLFNLGKTSMMHSCLVIMRRRYLRRRSRRSWHQSSSGG